MRLFIAAPITAEVKDEITNVIAKLKDSGAAVKWVAPSNIHLTLKFLGETEEDLLPGLKQIIDTIAKNYSAIETGISGLGCFPNIKRPRVYWIGLTKGKEVLAKVAADLEDQVHKLGFEKENRPFKSHLTLGRVKAPKGIQKLNEIVESIEVKNLPMIVDRIILFKSTLTPRGPIYEPLHEARLK